MDKDKTFFRYTKNQRIKETIMEEVGEYFVKLLIEAEAGAYHDPQERLGICITKRKPRASMRPRQGDRGSARRI